MATNDVVGRPPRRPRQLDAIHLLEQSGQHGYGFQSRQALARAGVGALPESDVAPGISADIENRGVVSLAFVASGRGVHDQDAGAGRDGDAGDLGGLAHVAREGAQR